MAFRNIPACEPLKLADLIACRPGRVSSMAFSSGKKELTSLFALAQGEEISSEIYAEDTVYYIVEGGCSIHVDAMRYKVQAGEVFFVPAGTMHALFADDNVKFLQLNR